MNGAAGPDDRARLRRLSDDVVALADQGDTGRALAIAEEAAEFARARFGERSVEHASQLTNIGVLADRTGDPERALRALDRAVEAFAGSGGQNLAATLLSKARLHRRSGQEVEALEALRTARAAAGTGLLRISVDAEVTSVLVALGRLDDARETAGSTVRATRHLCGETSGEYADALHQLAVIHFKTGDLDGAEAAERDVLAVRRRMHGERHPAVAAALRDLASAAVHRGRFGAAQRLLEQAADIWGEWAGHQLAAAEAYSALGEAYAATGEHQRAREAAERGVAVARHAGATGHELAARFRSVVVVHRAAGDRTAEAAALTAAEELVRDGGRNPLSEAVALGGQADVHYRAGEYEAAEPLYRQALALVESIDPPADAAVAALRHNLANLLSSTGRPEAALPLHAEAVAAARRARPPADGVLTGSLVEIAVLAADAGRTDLVRTAAGEVLDRLPLHDRRRTDVADALTTAGVPADDRFPGREPAEQVTELQSRAEELSAGGDGDAAALLHGRVVELVKELHGPSSAELATALGNHAFAQFELGRHEDAERLARESLALRRRLLPPDDPAIGLAEHMLARVLWQTGRTEKARRRAAKACRILEDAGMVRSAQRGAALATLARTELDLGAAHDAVPHARESAEIARDLLGDTAPRYARALATYTRALSAAGQDAEAVDVAREALAAARAGLGPDHPEVVDHAVTLAELLRAAGERVEARELAVGSWRQIETADDPSDGRRVTVARLLGRLALDDDEPVEARRWLRRAAAALPTAQESEIGRAPLLLDQALADAALGDLDGAEAKEREAARLVRARYGTAHRDYGRALLALGRTLVAHDRRAQGHEVLREALDTLEQVAGPADREAVAARAALAEVYLSIGAVDTARALLDQGWAALRRAHPPGHPDLAVMSGMRARVFALQGDVAAAERGYEEALRTLPDRSPARADFRSRLAVLLAATGRWDVAMDLLDGVAAAEDDDLDRALTVLSDRQRTDYLRSLSRTRDSYLTLLTAPGRVAASAVRRAFELVLRRKGAGVRAAAAHRSAVLTGRHPHLADALRERDELRSRLGRSETGEPDAEIERVRRRVEELDQLLAAPAGEQVPDMRPGVDEVAAQLPARTCLVELVRADVVDFARLALGKPAVPVPDAAQWDPRPGANPARYVAFVLPAGRPDRLEFVDLGSAQEIEALVEDLREELTHDPRGRVQDDGAAQRLADVLLAPILRHVPDHHGLLVAPDGPLSFIPFEVLPTAEGRLLLDDRPVGYVTTGPDVLGFRTAAAPRSAPVVVADPDFDLGSPPDVEVEGTVEPLPGTRREGEDVGTLLGTPALTGDRATRAAVLSVRGPAVLHVASHGFFLPAPRAERDDVYDSIRLIEVPGEGMFLAEAARETERVVEGVGRHSALALAGADVALAGRPTPAAVGDGLLTAEDLAALDLVGTQLVVLSACASGLGGIEYGDGVLGLRRGASVAGAQTLVMSLWKVPDTVARRLMVDYYQRLLRGEDRAEALRAARRALRARYSHPYYWAAFICQGRPGSIRLPTAGRRVQ